MQFANTYKQKKMSASLPYLADLDVVPLDIAVCIPCLDEYPFILQTIKSLQNAQNFFKANFAQQKIDRLDALKNDGVAPLPSHQIPRIAIIVCVNNRASHSKDVKIRNKQTFDALKNDFADFVVPIDCFSASKELPETDGAGLARKIPLDYGYLCLTAQKSAHKKLLCCMDADTLVEENYFCEIYNAFAKKGKVGVTDFAHRKDGSEQENHFIALYEDYLKTHAQKMQKAKSPWYPVALGPTIVCTLDAYAQSGGMSRRCAGEDFYFLQALLKLCIPFKNRFIARINTCVHPSPRVSDRVPFGTGAAIKQAVAGTKMITPFADEFYKILGAFIATIEDEARFIASANANNAQIDVLGGAQNVDLLMAKIEKIDGNLANFLHQEKFESIWAKMVQQHKKSSAQLICAFHCWFDGLKTIRLFHHLQKSAPVICV